MDAIGATLRQLFAVCLAASAAEALFGGAGEGVRMICGLSAALCVARLAAKLLGVGI